MATYLIGYDLNTPDKDYTDLEDAIKSLSGTWWHHLDSTWLIKHTGPAWNIRDQLTPHVEEADELLVVELTGEGAWSGFNQRGSKWLKDYL